MEVMLFGQLADIAGKPTLQADNVADTDQLKARLEESFPSLRSVKYMVALNKKIVNENTALQGNETIALMPPFSGG